MEAAMSPRSASTRFALVAAALSLLTPIAHANCTQSVMPIFQCGYVGWFAPPPPGSGTVNSTWWQLGYGNNRVNNGVVATPANEGTGIAPAGVFSGNDGGLSRNYTYLTLADSVLPQYAAQIPDGSTCLNFEWSWAGVGVDGCADNPRTTSAFDNDNLLNPYWGGAYGYCPDVSADCAPQYTTAYHIDYPMAFLLRESNNRFFALAFVASKARVDPYDPPVPGGKAKDISENFFDLAEVSNGIPNPTIAGPAVGKNNIIPWQMVPRPRWVSGWYVSPNEREIIVDWDNIQLIHDQSVRPNPRLPSGGVGVLDQLSQGPLCRYQVQRAIVSSYTPDPSTLTWTNEGPEIPCPAQGGAVSAQFIVPRYETSAIRIRTILGKQPRTTATTLANCRQGACGDLGYEATDCKADNCVNGPPMLLVYGPLVSEQAVDTVAERNRNAVVVRFRTTSELTISSIDILGKGDAVVAGVPCKQCTSGSGDSYEILLTPGDLKGARELRVRLNGPDAVSEPFPVH
jgi:hypothetical protein